MGKRTKAAAAKKIAGYEKKISAMIKRIETAKTTSEKKRLGEELAKYVCGGE